MNPASGSKPDVGFTWKLNDPSLGRINDIGLLTVEGDDGTYEGSVSVTGVREGVDDLRYVYTLRQAIDDALASKDPEQVAAGRAAGERLGRILAPIGIDGPGELRGGDLDDARRQVAGLIVGLQ